MTTINDQGICYHDIMWRITNACNKMDGAYYFCGKKLGIKENTLTIIYALEDGQPHSQKQISEEWLIPKTTINTTVKEMMQEGLITFLPGGKEKAIDHPLYLLLHDEPNPEMSSFVFRETLMTQLLHVDGSTGGKDHQSGIRGAVSGLPRTQHYITIQCYKEKRTIRLRNNAQN